MKKRIAVFALLAAGLAAMLVIGCVAMEYLSACDEAGKRQALPTLKLAQYKVRSDHQLYTRTIADITTETLERGKSKAAEVAAMLADETLNRLAAIYTGSDWALQRSAFVGGVKHLRAIGNMQKSVRTERLREVSRRIDQLNSERRRAVSGMTKLKGPSAHSPTRTIFKGYGTWHLGNWWHSHRASWRTTSQLERIDADTRARINAIDRELAMLSAESQCGNLGVDEQIKCEDEIFALAAQYHKDNLEMLDGVFREWDSAISADYARAAKTTRTISVWRKLPFGCLIPSSAKARIRKLASDRVLQASSCLPFAIEYSQSASTFVCDEVERWRNAADSVKPGAAASGTTYNALVLDDNDNLDIYNIEVLGNSKMAVALLSPVAPPLPMEFGDFRAACKGRKYFIAHGGKVYLCGKTEQSDLDSLWRLLSRLQ